MPVTGIVTLIGVGLIVAALAIYLIWVAALLQRVSSMLTTIIDRLWGISASAEPLGGAVREINRDLDATRQTLGQVLQKKTQQAQQSHQAQRSGSRASRKGTRKAAASR